MIAFLQSSKTIEDNHRIQLEGTATWVRIQYFASLHMLLAHAWHTYQSCSGVYKDQTALLTTGYTIHCTLYTVHDTLYTIHCTLYTVHYTLYTIHYTLYTVHNTQYTVHNKLYTVHYCTALVRPEHLNYIHMYTCKGTTRTSSWILHGILSKEWSHQWSCLQMEV